MLRPLLFLLAVMFISGCGSSTDVFTNNGGGFTAGTPTLENGRFNVEGVTGTVWLEGPTPAFVRVFPHNGVRRIEATLADGNVMLADVSLPSVDALALTNGQSAGPFDEDDWIWVTPVSTLLAVYRDLRPELSDTERLSRLKVFLGIGADQSVNRPFSSVANSEFSPGAFLEAAEGKIMKDFSAQLIAELESLPARGFLEFPEEGESAPTSSRGVALLDSIGGNLISDVIWKALGFAVGKTFLGNSTQKQLNEIQNQLADLSGQLDAIENDLTTLGTGILAEQVSSADISPVKAYYTLENTMLVNSETNYTPFSFNNAGFLASNNLTALTNASDPANALKYAQGILGGCLNIDPYANQGNIITGYTGSFAAAWGSGASNSALSPSNHAFYYDYRNDVHVTPNLQQATSYYLGYLGHAANMLAESYTQALGSNLTAPTPSLQTAQSLIRGSRLSQTVLGDSSKNGLLALGKRMLQQAPLAQIGGSSALETVWGAPAVSETIAGQGEVNGTMWALCAEVTHENDNGGSAVYLDTVGRFNVGNFYNWYLPSNAEAAALSEAAALAAQTDGITDKNKQVPYGLHKMGLLSDENYSDDLENVGIYTKLETSSKNKPECDIYKTKDRDSDSGGLYEAGLNSYGFKSSKDDVRLVLLVRPFPGQPLAAGKRNQSATGVATTSAPAAVKSSQSANGIEYFWNSDLCLAGNLPPTEIVVERDSGSNQLRAYGVWRVDWPVVPSSYLNTAQEFDGLSKYYPQPGTTPSAYVVYDDLTDVVEWLSSNTSDVEVTNHRISNLSARGGTVSGGRMTGPGLLIDNVTYETNTLFTELTGGTILGGTFEAGNLDGGTYVALGTPASGDVTGATIVGGTISKAILGDGLDGDQNVEIFTLKSLNGDTRSIGMGGSMHDVTASGGIVTLPRGSGSPGGVVLPHNANSVTITASLLTSPSTTANTTNNVGSTATTVTGTITLPGAPPPPPLHQLVLTPNYSEINLLAGGSNLKCWVTQFSSDGTVTDMSTNPGTKYQLFQQTSATEFEEVPESEASFGGTAPGGGSVQPNVLQFHSGFSDYSGPLIIRATNGSLTGYSFLQALAAP